LRRLIDTADDFGEELSVEVRQENTDGAGATGDQAAGGAVRAVAQPRGHFAHPASGDFLNEVTAVLDSGHRGDGDSCRTGYILDRDHRDGRLAASVPVPRSGEGLITGAHRPCVGEGGDLM
jgi:hypothetical protein